MRPTIIFCVILAIAAIQAPACEDSAKQNDSAKAGPANAKNARKSAETLVIMGPLYSAKLNRG